jgi:hypothetical protein
VGAGGIRPAGSDATADLKNLLDNDDLQGAADRSEGDAVNEVT